MNEDWLGADGFVFLDDRPWAYMVSDRSGEWWLYYWADRLKKFATLRKVTLEEVEKFRALALPADKAALYAPRPEPQL